MRVAAHLRIPFIEIDLSKEYQRRVFAISMNEFAAGRTPNPDALCNREIKFGVFFDFAMKQGADFVATGHYAQLKASELFAGADDSKDQSYFLWAVPEVQLAKTLFPVGGLRKTEVRRLAKKYKLPNSARRDSQGLCFLGDISLDDMLRQEIKPVPGVVLSEEGKEIGAHDGVQLYTLGQRHGFALASGGSSERPHFVIAKNLGDNTITVSENKYPQGAKETTLMLEQGNWIGTVSPGKYTARFRYRQTLIAATLQNISDGTAKVALHEPHYAPLGQSLVLYEGERCIGGGIITEASIA